MNPSDQTICPQCKCSYNDKNPPRLLTMCGHSFCEKCIKELIPKKKINGKVKVACPIDKKSIELFNPNANLFPKNLALVTLVQSSSKDIHLNGTNGVQTHHGHHEPNKSQSIRTIQQNDNALPHLPSQKLLDQILLNTLKDICLLHQKPLDLICVRDCQKICTSCVIFGEHKGHAVKKCKEVEERSKILQEKMKVYMNQITIYTQSIDNKASSAKVQAMITKKKSELQKEIKTKFKQIISEVQHQQQKVLSKLDRTIEDIRTKMRNSQDDKITLRDQLKDWERDLMHNFKILQQEEQEQRLKFVLKPQIYMETCQKNVQMLKQLSTQVLRETQKSLDNLTVICQAKQIKKMIKQHCKIEDSSNSFLDIDMSIIKGNANGNANNLLKTGHQESLLDDLEDNSLANSEVKPRSQRPQQSTEYKVRRREDLAKPEAITRLGNRIKSSQKLLSVSQKKNSGLSSSKLLSKDSHKHFPLLSALKTKQLPEKYSPKIQQILKGQSDVLDLTNGQLGTPKLLSLLETLSPYNIGIAKLVRNKLDDEFLEKGLPLLSGIIMLNLSRNQLTERALGIILSYRRQGKLGNLKSLMIGQNKIVERNNKDVIEELKKLGINVCM